MNALTSSLTSSSASEAYSDNFVDDMSPALAAEYLVRLPFCRRTVLDVAAAASRPDFLSQLRDARLARFIPPSWPEVLDRVWLRPYLTYMQRSGKLLRPFLVCLCMQAYGREPARSPVAVALAEMIHSASLLLDDIVDDSPLRRGGPSAHTQVGIRVSGTIASAWLNLGFELLDRIPGDLSASERAALMREIAWEHWVTGIGTTIDVVWPTLEHFEHRPHEYLQAVAHRSTSYTYRLPLKIGAIAAGAPPEQVARFAALGEEVGLAFQLIDDILNLKPGDAHWGKVVAEDITEGKITLQVLLAMQLAGADAARRLAQILRLRTREPSLLAEAVAIIESCGAFEQARAQAREHVERAMGIVTGMDFLPAYHRQLLTDFVTYVVERSR